jgi:hypothetical protein
MDDESCKYDSEKCRGFPSSHQEKSELHGRAAGRNTAIKKAAPEKGATHG